MQRYEAERYAKGPLVSDWRAELRAVNEGLLPALISARSGPGRVAVLATSWWDHALMASPGYPALCAGLLQWAKPAALAAESFDPLVESWIEADADLVPPADAPPRGATATIVRDDPQVVEIRASLEAPGLVVLADTYASGWRATVDGRPAPILPTNHLFRGVPAPAGEHLVRFEYRPWSVRLGVAVSLVTALALGVLAWGSRTSRGTR